MIAPFSFDFLYVFTANFVCIGGKTTVFLGNKSAESEVVGYLLMRQYIIFDRSQQNFLFVWSIHLINFPQFFWFDNGFSQFRINTVRIRLIKYILLNYPNQRMRMSITNWANDFPKIT